MFDLIQSAHAQAAAAQGAPDAGMVNILFLVILFVIFYFLLFRPQQKQMREHKEMVDNLQRGDSVVTGGGILGRIHRIDDDVAVVEVAEVKTGDRTNAPVHIRVRKSTITAVTAKSSPPRDGQPVDK
jgi:preprotein translocase subunit YajC